MAENFDLFGDPVPANWKGRGRPEHIPTLENRNKVNLLLALGWTNDRIAKALSVTLPTLRKHYFSQLKVRDDMRDKLEARLGEKLMEGVNAGSVSHIKEMRKFLERSDMMLAGAAYFHTTKPEKPKAEKLGKKEEAQRAAHTGHEGTEWSTLVQ